MMDEESGASAVSSVTSLNPELGRMTATSTDVEYEADDERHRSSLKTHSIPNSRAVDMGSSEAAFRQKIEDHNIDYNVDSEPASPTPSQDRLLNVRSPVIEDSQENVEDDPTEIEDESAEEEEDREEGVQISEAFDVDDLHEEEPTIDDESQPKKKKKKKKTVKSAKRQYSRSLSMDDTSDSTTTVEMRQMDDGTFVWGIKGMNLHLQESIPEGARDGKGWVLVDPVTGADHKITTTLQVIHRVDGEGKSIPEIVQPNKPEITLTCASTHDSLIASIDEFLRKRFDGCNVAMTSRATETDWEWVEDMIIDKDPAVFSVWNGEESGSEKTDATDASQNVETDVRDLSKKPEVSAKRKKKKKKKKKKGSGEESGASGDERKKSILSSPRMSLKDGSSDSEKDDDLCPPHNTDHLIPSVGPPDIIRYLPESAEKKMAPVERSSLIPTDITDVKCEFCKKQLLPFPTMEEQQTKSPETLFCCEEYREFCEETWKDQARLEEKASSDSLMIDISSHPHYGSVAARKLARDQALEKQRERTELRHAKSTTQANMSYSLHNSTPSIKSSSTNPRKASQLPQLSNTTSGLLASSGQPPLTNRSSGITGVYKDIDSTSMGSDKSDKPNINDPGMSTHARLALLRAQNTSVGRQMKTLNYQLSSQKCIDDGWTIPFWDMFTLSDDDEVDVFVPKPRRMGAKSKNVIKTYENGSTFLVMLEDGSATVYYPNGQPAIFVIPVDRFQCIFVVMDEKEGKVLATFDPMGVISCSDVTGIPRLVTDAVGGTEYDSKCNRRRIWRWHELEPHIHAPPLQPISLTLSPSIHIRILTQENIQLTFRSNDRSCRFNVGSKLQVVAPESIPQRELDPMKVYMDAMIVRIQTILDKVNNIFRYKKSPKATLILPPLYIAGKIDRVTKLKQELAKSKTNKDKNAIKIPSLSVIVN